MRSLANLPRRVWRFYYDGFRSMTTGRSLWVLILVKLVLFFLVMKLLFFPNLLERDYDNDADRADAVRSSLLDERR
ncbi:MAG: DUF4492 domain-containing protein [Candidatus Amulumruptor caecigallinarius]|nr:DUF4492 domain-containing protein [Candidatus Amulumruptor caecigallinarius]MCM1453873.1 DUF4492 domain-containing protein [bacterium]